MWKGEFTWNKITLSPNFCSRLNIFLNCVPNHLCSIFDKLDPLECDYIYTYIGYTFHIYSCYFHIFFKTPYLDKLKCLGCFGHFNSLYLLDFVENWVVLSLKTFVIAFTMSKHNMHTFRIYIWSLFILGLISFTSFEVWFENNLVLVISKMSFTFIQLSNSFDFPPQLFHSHSAKKFHLYPL